MAIRKPTPPPDVVDAFFKQLPQFVWQAAETVFQRYVGEMRAPSLQDLGQLDDPDLIHDPQPLFLLGLKEIAENAGVKAAKPAGWRFFAGRREGAIVMGKLSIRIPSEGWKLTAGNYGDRTWAVISLRFWSFHAGSMLRNTAGVGSLLYQPIPTPSPLVGSAPSCELRLWSMSEW